VWPIENSNATKKSKKIPKGKTLNAIFDKSRERKTLMEQVNYNLNEQKKQHLTEEERANIEMRKKEQT